MERALPSKVEMEKGKKRGNKNLTKSILRLCRRLKEYRRQVLKEMGKVTALRLLKKYLVMHNELCCSKQLSES